MSKTPLYPIQLFLFIAVLYSALGGCAHSGKSPPTAGENSSDIKVSQNADSSDGDQAHESDDLEADDELFLLDDEEDTAVVIKDPFYHWNRAIFTFNDRFYFLVAKPVTQAYAKVVHKDLRTVINNFFLNISMPIRFVNSLLQFKLKAAGTELVRFGINTTIGVVGLQDVAKSEFGLESSDEDLGQTLGRYKLGHGAYVVLPFLGPSSIRDSVGLIGDIFLYPIGYMKPAELSWGLYTYEHMNRFTFNVRDYEILKDAAIDPYSAVRDVYYQNRKAKVAE